MGAGISRRTLLCGLAAGAAGRAALAPAMEVYLSPAGRDTNPGTKARPLRTLSAAQQAARKLKGKGPVSVWLRAGTYYLPKTVVFTEEDSGTSEAPVTYSAFPGEDAVVSGGTRLLLSWKPYRDGIMQARTPAGIKADQLFVDGERQHLARYPNYDPAAGYWDGWSPDAISKERAAKWKDPRGAFFHTLHRNLWGSQHYVITGKDKEGNLTYEGGSQLMSACGVWCSGCPAYLAGVKGVAHQQRTAAAWERIYGLNESAESIACGGCLAPDDQVFRTCRACKARLCCHSKGLTTCAECPVDDCPDLEHAQSLWDGLSLSSSDSIPRRLRNIR